MATENEEILLKIKVENSEAIEEIVRLQDNVKSLNESTKNLTDRNKQLEKQMADMAKQGKEGSSAFKALAAELEANKKEIVANSMAAKNYTGEIQANTKQLAENINKTKTAQGSLNAMSQELGELKKQYRAMTKEERESAAGKEMVEHMKSLSDALKEEEEAYGSTGRNVGNYEEAIRKALEANKGMSGGMMGNVKSISAMSQSAGGLANLMKGALKTAINTINSALKMLMANPIVALIAAVVAIIMGLIKVMKGNEEQMRKLQKLFAPFQAFLDFIVKILQKVADGLIAVLGWIGKAIGGLSSMLEKLPFVGDAIKDINDAAKEAVALEERKQKLQDAQRNNLVEFARKEKDIARLKSEAAEKDKYTAEERKAKIEQALKLEQEIMDEKVRMKKEELAIAEAEAARNKNSEEANQRIAELKAEVYNMEKEGYAKQKELNAQRVAFEQELVNEQKKAAEDKKKRAEEYRKMVESGEKQLQQLTFDLMADGLEKEKAMREAKYKEELKSVQGTAQQKAEIKKKLEEKYLKDLAALEDKYNQEALARAVEARTMELNALLELAGKDVDKRLDVQLEQLEAEKAAAIKAAEEKGANVEIIEQLYAQKRTDLETQAEEDRKTARAEKLAQLLSETAEQYEQQLQMLSDNLEAQAEVELEAEQAKLEALQNITDEQKAAMFESEEAYQEAIRNQIQLTDEAQKRSTEESKKARVAALEDAKSKMDGLSNIAGSITEIFSQIAGDNEVMQKFLKGVALFQIGVDMAKAIAGAISGAMTTPFPGNIAAVAAGVATVVAGIVQAKQVLSQSKEAAAPKFATGGLVTGAGTGTSDSVPAMLSNGESVMTAAATAMFAPMLSAMNVAGGGVPITVGGTVSAFDMDAMMGDSLAKAFSSMPAPVVSVQEINSVNDRVAVLDGNINR